MRPALPPRPASGFTLLETLVTLVVVAMITALLMQALGFSLGIRERLLRHQAIVRVSALQEQWFRDSVSAAAADLADGLGAAQGSSEQFSLVSADPLGGAGLRRIVWALAPRDDGLALVYRDDGGAELEIIPGPLLQARFDYLGQAGAFVPDWAPDAADKRAPVLPRLVRLQAQTTRGELLWLAPLISDPVPSLLLRPDADGI